jgi:hypothetical protein
MLSATVSQLLFWIPLSSIVYSVFFLWGDQSVQGVVWFIPGVAEGYRVMLGAHLFGLLKVSEACLELVAGRLVGGWQWPPK